MDKSGHESNPHNSAAAPAVEEVSVPLDTSTKRAFRVFLGLVVIVIYGLFWRFGLRSSWGQWSMRAQMAAAVIPAFFTLLWVPVVWASLRWMLRDFIRAQKAPQAAKHAKKPQPFSAAFSFLLTAGILAFVATRAWGGYGLAVQDWWDGPTRHENVSCQNIREEGDETFLKCRRILAALQVRALRPRKGDGTRGQPLHHHHDPVRGAGPQLRRLRLRAHGHHRRGLEGTVEPAPIRTA